MRPPPSIRYKCRACGLLTTGARRGRKHKAYPRRHRVFGGATCPGVFEPATIVRIDP